MPSDNLTHRLPRHLKMSELRIFVAVLTHRNFHKAAVTVNLSQPAVTKSIAGLEQTLNVKLFERHANGVEPTSYGLCFAPRAIAIFEELRRAALDLAALSSGAAGELRIGTVSMPAIPFLPIAVKHLVRKHPDCLVSVAELRETELLQRLRKGDIELALLRLPLLKIDADMQVDALFDEQLCVIGARDHPLLEREQLGWDELLQQAWVLPPPDCVFYGYVARTLAHFGLAMPRPLVEAHSVQGQAVMVTQGGMLSFGMRSQGDCGAAKNELARLPIELPGGASPVAAVSLRGRDVSPLARQLLAHIRSQVVAGTLS